MAQPFDGLVESAAILARLKVLCGGRVFDHIADSETPALPFIGVLTGQPIAAAGDRNLGGERVQSHILLASIIIEGTDTSQAGIIAGAVTNLLLDWAPSATSTGMVTAGGDSFPRAATSTLPSRQVITSRFKTTINL